MLIKTTEAIRASEPGRDVLLAAKGGAITFAGKLFTLACRLVITFLLTRLLGAEQYGLYHLALTALTVAAALAACGLDSTLVRYVPIFAQRRDEAGLWGALRIALGSTLALSGLFSVALYLQADAIAEGIFRDPQLAPLLRMASLAIPILTIGNVMAAATQGFKKMQYATIARDIAQPLIRLALVVGLAIAGPSAAGALAIFGIALAISTIMLLFFLHRLFPLRRAPHTARYDTAAIFGFAIPFFLSDLMTTFRDNVQTLLLGALNTIESVGVFVIANQITMIGSAFHSAIAAASKPLVAELHDRGAWGQLARIYQTTTKWTFTVNLPLFLIIILFPEHILAIFGQSFIAGTTALVLLAWAIMADVSTGMCGLILDMTGHTGLKLANSIIRLGLSIGLSAWLIPTKGIVGAAIVVLISVGAVNVLRLAQVFALFRLLPYELSILKPLGAGLAALLVVLALGRLTAGATSLLAAALQALTLCAVYVGAILLLGLSDDDRAVLARARSRMSARLSRDGERKT